MGGVISCHSDVVLIIVGSTIEHNTARIGGVVQATEIFINITIATIHNKIAISGVFSLEECTLVIENVVITSNIANLKAVILKCPRKSYSKFSSLILMIS